VTGKLTVLANVVGRVSTSDQFTLTVSQAGVQIKAASTIGEISGIQSPPLGPVTVVAGATYSVAASVQGNASDYVISSICVDDLGSRATNGASSRDLTMPTRPNASVNCTFTIAPLVTTVTVQTIVRDAGGALLRPDGWVAGMVATGLD